MNVLHLSHHDGCRADIEYVGSQLFWNIVNRETPLYNVSADVASALWSQWRSEIQTADVVITSDTSSLSRVILQHIDQFKGRLVIWVCNRFDYADEATNNCGFPDTGFYGLFRMGLRHSQVRVAAYTEYERTHARSKHIELPTEVVRPIGLRQHNPHAGAPEGFNKDMFFLPTYHNDTIFMDLKRHCEGLGIPVIQKRYGHPKDVAACRGVIHLPYCWSGLAIFENLQNGVQYFIPSKAFFLHLVRHPGYWFQNWIDAANIEQCEFYAPDLAPMIVYFDSWEDLKAKVQIDYTEKANLMNREWGPNHALKTLLQWKELTNA